MTHFSYGFNFNLSAHDLITLLPYYFTVSFNPNVGFKCAMYLALCHFVIFYWTMTATFCFTEIETPFVPHTTTSPSEATTSTTSTTTPVSVQTTTGTTSVATTIPSVTTPVTRPATTVQVTTSSATPVSGQYTRAIKYTITSLLFPCHDVFTADVFAATFIVPR